VSAGGDRGPRRPGDRAAGVLLIAALLVALGSATRETPAWPAGELIDPNTAAAGELAMLPGIGPRLADAIVVERERGGPFATVEDLARTPRIGPALVERVAPYVWIAPNGAYNGRDRLKTDPPPDA